MRISGSTPPLHPAASQARGPRRAEADVPVQTPALVPTPETSEPEAPAETGKLHGLVRASEHSHRSDVAALRQWINHPDLRNDLSLPDLSAEHKGNGFRNAVAAYEAAIAAGNSPTATDPSPVVTDPALVGTDPVPVDTDPVPVNMDPVLVNTDPVPAVTDPDPVVTNPEPVVTVSEPVVVNPGVADPDPLFDLLLPESHPAEIA